MTKILVAYGFECAFISMSAAVGRLF